MYASGSEIVTFGPDNFAHDLLERAGGQNVFADAETPYPQISAEQVLERNPDFIIIAHHQAAAEDVRARPGWSSLTAVRKNRIYPYRDPDEFLRPGPRLVNVLEWLARVLHPEME
jgi:iron complex transport system substrate-binding protein